MKKIPLKAYERKTEKKSDLRKLREEGFVPAVIYGEGVEESKTVSVAHGELLRLLRKRRHADFLIDLEVEETKEKFITLLQDVQFHPVTDRIIHADFYSVSLEKPIYAKIPVHLVGEARGVKEGGVLYQVLHEIEIEAKPLDLPSVIEVDVTELEIGDSVHVGDIKIEGDVKVITPPEETVVTVSEPEKVVEAAPAEEELEEEEAPAEEEGKETEVKEEEKKEE
ncbi:MAG: 50S ribosomal protein L25/general stress protein Ctc [Caldisericia bacterium]|nr:50S ribosomal protein L25/general stress protein Ctc [Caldisericia bacterium]